MNTMKGALLGVITVFTASLVTATLTLAPMNLKATTDEDLALELEFERDGEVRKQDIKSADQSSNAAVEIDIEKKMESDEERDDLANTWDRTIDRPGEKEDIELSGSSNENSAAASVTYENSFTIIPDSVKLP
jgi:hypothetical protein